MIRLARYTKIFFQRKIYHFCSQNNQKGDEDINKPEEELTREEYIQKIRKEREIKEKVIADSRKLEIQYDKIKIKQNEERFGKFDAFKTILDNINVFPQQFEHPDQLFYYIEQLETRLTEENLKKCIDSFIRFSDTLSEQQLERPQFNQFLDSLQNHFNLIQSQETLLTLVLFSDLYCVDNSEYWEHLERRILRSFEKFNLEQHITLFTHFAHQKEGSEYFYNTLEKAIDLKVQNLTFTQCVQITDNFKRVSMGSVEFVAKILQIISSRFEKEATFDSVLILSGSLKDIVKLHTDGLYTQIENFLLLQNLQQKNSKDICLLANNLGLEKGSRQLFKSLESALDLENTPLQELLEGFIFNYRGSKSLFLALIPRIENQLNSISTPHLANIVKSYYIVELDQPQLFSKIEASILASLKNVSLLTIQEIFEVAKSYNVTRLGSREFYKILELVIQYRFPEIIQQHHIVRGLHAMYSQSGLISQKMLSKLESVS